ncbi:MAG: VWA domain-containing protein [Pseudomonadota bacterium]
MKRNFFLYVLLAFSSFAAAQDMQHDVIIRNIEVPVQVYDGNEFVTDLKLNDFELYENGISQKIIALYLVKQDKILKMDAETDLMPYTPRKYFFIFQMTEYNSKITEALDFFFSDIYRPEDSVEIITSVKEYFLSSDALKSNTKDKVVEFIGNVVRKDAKIGSTEYNSLLQNLKKIAAYLTPGGGSWSGFDSMNYGLGISPLLERYHDSLLQLDNMRKVDEKEFIRYARTLKKLDGQKYVFFFYEREYMPELRGQAYSNLMSLYQDQPNIVAMLQEIFQFYHRPINMNLDHMISSFADSNILFNLICMDKRTKSAPGLDMQDQSEDIIKILSNVASATGGRMSDTTNPLEAFKSASTAVNTRYLLYYSPMNYQADGSFKKIQVLIKNQHYKIFYRKGYIAD